VILTSRGLNMLTCPEARALFLASGSQYKSHNKFRL
jgi:hypothetical protein